MAKAKKKAKRKTAAKRKTTAKRKGSARRTVVAPRGDKRFVRRTPDGQFNEVDDAGSSQTVDRKRKAKKKAKRGQGDRGDR